MFTFFAFHLIRDSQKENTQDISFIQKVTLSWLDWAKYKLALNKNKDIIIFVTFYSVSQFVGSRK